MQMLEVESTNLKRIGFENSRLRVEFQSGAAYEYDGVPKSVFDALCGADKKGEFFAAAVKGRYPFRRVSR